MSQQLIFGPFESFQQQLLQLHQKYKARGHRNVLDKKVRYRRQMGLEYVTFDGQRWSEDHPVRLSGAQLDRYYQGRLAGCTEAPDAAYGCNLFPCQPGAEPLAPFSGRGRQQ